MSLLKRIARGLDLDRIGQRRSWTVRLPHGVYLVALRQSVLGDHILVDGREVARLEPWEYERSLRFPVGEGSAELRPVTDTGAGTFRTDLYVDGVLVPADERHAAPPARVRWGPRLERAGYAFGGVLLFAGLVGAPIFDVVRQVVWLGGLLLLFVGLRAIDVFGAIALTFDKMIEDRVSMMVAGVEIVLITMVAADRWRLRKRVPFIRETGWVPRALGWIAIITLAFVVLASS
jgi:hypothetical protein